MKSNKWLMGAFGLLVSFILTAILIKYFRDLNKGKGLQTRDSETKKPVAEDQIVIEETDSAEPDDLTRIKGIGPKIATVLQEAGITTFAQLAAMDPESINDILHQAGVPIAASETWPKQAQAAMAGN